MKHLNPNQRGDELCQNCKARWCEHKGTFEECPIGGSYRFLSSGRIDVPRTTEIHNHFGASSVNVPSRPPDRPVPPDRRRPYGERMG
jgi:hypothetical protein